MANKVIKFQDLRIETLWTLSFLLLLISCNGFSSNKSGDNSGYSDEYVQAPVLEQLVYEWNNAHNVHYDNIFSRLYHQSVLYYGTMLDGSNCVTRKMNYFQKHPDFRQEITSNIETLILGNGEARCSFEKTVTVSGSRKPYPAYLVFKKVDYDWKIITEGDLITDRNLSKRNSGNNSIPPDAVKGDFNGDGKLDYMWLAAPRLNSSGTDCIGGCTSYIKFSDSSIPPIMVDNCINGTPSNEGDLNKNGTDEIGLLPGWFSSCWRDYRVWTFSAGRWINAVQPFSTHCNQWDEGIRPIEIDRGNSGYVTIRYSDMSDEGIVVKSKSVRIAR